MVVDWEEIRLQNATRMWSIAWRILQDESDALDCCQDVFAEAIERDKQTPKKPIKNWEAFLTWLTTRRAIDMLRRRNRSSQLSLLGVQDVLLIDQLGTAESNLEFAELKDWVLNQLTNMNGQMAECFWLCCVDEMSYLDAAQQLGISPNHVRVNVHRAREFLKNRIARQTLTKIQRNKP